MFTLKLPKFNNSNNIYELILKTFFCVISLLVIFENLIKFNLLLFTLLLDMLFLFSGTGYQTGRLSRKKLEVMQKKAHIPAQTTRIKVVNLNLSAKQILKQIY